MLDDDTSTTTSTPDTSPPTEAPPRRTRRRAASRPAGPPAAEGGQPSTAEVSAPPSDLATGQPGETTEAPATTTAKKASTRKSATKKASTAKTSTTKSAAKAASSKKASTRKSRSDSDDQTAAAPDSPAPSAAETTAPEGSTAPTQQASAGESPSADAQDAQDAGGAAFAPLFQPPAITTPAPRAKSASKSASTSQEDASQTPADASPADSDSDESDSAGSKRRRSRGGRNRKKSATDATADQQASPAEAESPRAKSDTTTRSTRSTRSAKSGKGDDSGSTGAEEDKDDKDSSESGSSSRRRRRRSRSGDESGESTAAKDSSSKTREPKSDKEAITSVSGSTRIEAKKQRRREGREAGRRRPPILSESEFLARRESVDRVMAIRQHGEKTQIAVLEDNVLVEHYVALESQGSIIGNVYLGRVQNVLPSMEAAFIDIGRGRNAVLYAGEVNWSLVGDRNSPRRIENALKPGQAVLVQVTKDPIGHKGARLTAQISLPGRYLVLVPEGGTNGISRKLPDTERNRLKTLLKDILPDDAGVIIRTAAEGASEEALTRDVNRLTARWEDIEKKVKAGQAPTALYAEPDTTLKVVRDLFTEDFSKLVISGDDAWDIVDGYVQHVAPDLAERLERYDGDGDLFADRRVDEQIAKALERKVWLPSGGSLVIDRTEAMTVVDVNTGKFTGAGGNLEETVTKNNLEAAEEIVRQLRLRDIGGIIVVDFIDMVLESNRDLVLRRLVECLGRDRTRHQVAEVTSLGLVQMTRKRIGTGLLEAFSHNCEHCQGRGVVIESEPIESKPAVDAGSQRGSGSRRSGGRRRGGKSGGSDSGSSEGGAAAGSASGSDDGSADKGTPNGAPDPSTQADRSDQQQADRSDQQQAVGS